VYVHRVYEHLLPEAVIQSAKARLPTTFTYDVVKYRAATKAVSFIRCPEFDTSPEPSVGESVIVKRDGTIRTRRPPPDPEIYHHKWLFVADDYCGFDVEQSKRRSHAINQLHGIDRYRIGRKSYWEMQVLPKLRVNPS